ncbi:MAG: recombination protein NinB [Sulfitobacter sp.]
MANGQTIILHGSEQRGLAKRLVDAAPSGCVVNIRQATRTTDQNARLWAMLSDISRAKPQGRKHTPDVWKALMMKACGHQVQFEIGIDGEPFPVGFRSSKMNKSQMSDMIEFMYQYGAENGVLWTEPMEATA